MSKTRSRRWRRVLLAGAATFLLLLAAHPIWFPWVLGPLARQQGVTFETMRREGYGGLRCTGVRWVSGRTRIDIREVRLDGPVWWLWRRYGRALAGEAAAPQLEVDGWRVEVAPGDPTRPVEGMAPRSTSAVLEFLERAAPTVGRWLARGVLRGGAIVVPGSPGEIRLNDAEWRDGRLTATVEPPEGVVGRIRMEMVAPGMQPGLVRADAGERVGSIGLTIARSGNGWAIAGAAEGMGNRVPIEARFGPEGWWPEQARFAATNVTIPAVRLGLEGYESVRGSMVWDWREGRFTLTVAGSAAPALVEPVWQPPMEFELRAGGDFESVRVEALRVQAPWFQTELSRPTTLLREAPWVAEPMALRVAADLERVPASPFRGRLSGQVQAMPVLGGTPRVRFALVGEGVSWRGIGSRTLELGGVLEWPRLDVERCEVTLEAGGDLSVGGVANLRSRVVEFGQWNLSGDWAHRWLPAGWVAPDVQASGFVQGAVTNLVHGGRLEAKNFAIPGAKPLEVAIGWEAEVLKFREFNAAVSAGGSRIESDGRGEIALPFTEEQTVTIDAVRWTSGGRLMHRLVAPCAVRLIPGRGAAEGRPGGWRVAVGHAELRGPERALTIEGDVEWPSRGRFAVAARGVSLRDVGDFVEVGPPAIDLENGTLSMAWETGAAELRGDVAGRWDIPGELAVGVRTRFEGGSTGVRLESLRMDAGGGEVLEAAGDIPLMIVPSSVGRVLQWNEAVPFNLTLQVHPDDTVQSWVERRLGVGVVEPRLRMVVSGLRTNPLVRLEGTAGRLTRVSVGEGEPIAIEALEVKAEVDRRQVRLGEGAAVIEGQRARLEGEIPWPPGPIEGWAGKDLWGAFRAGRVRVQVRDAMIDPFGRYLPRFLAHQGRVEGDVEWRAGGLTGEISVEGAAMAPLGFLTPVREIAARVVFEGRSARLDRCEGRVGGQALLATGGGRVEEDGSLRFDLALRGTNLPLVRRRGLLLRSDLDLRVMRTNEGPAAIGGEVKVHDSLFVEDLGLLVPGPAGPPEERPPFFQVRAAPYSAWRLGVHLRGDPALRVYSPIFQGTVGSDLRLQGTLGEPVLAGEVRAVSGRVLFPFGNLGIEHAAVVVSASDPGTPELEVRASALNYGYRIQMDVSGPVREPVVMFTSTPPLNSQEILLMLTAGSVPQGRMSYSTQDKVGRFGLILGRDFLTRLGFSDSSSERLEFRTGEYVSEEGRPTQQVEYRLSEHWSAYGEYDRFGGINGGLKWRILSR